MSDTKKCERCNGSGFYYQHIAPWDGPSEPCPDCNGLGHVLDLREHVEYQLESQAVDAEAELNERLEERHGEHVGMGEADE